MSGEISGNAGFGGPSAAALAPMKATFAVGRSRRAKSAATCSAQTGAVGQPPVDHVGPRDRLAGDRADEAVEVAGVRQAVAEGEEGGEAIDGRGRGGRGGDHEGDGDGAGGLQLHDDLAGRYGVAR
jgi:hypothetical protein